MNFSHALDLLKSGHKLARKGWNGKGMYIELYQSQKPEYLPWLRMYTVDQKFVPWLASQTDLLANDWELV